MKTRKITIENRTLDSQQTACVLCDAHNQLIIAGAGTGKTTTIIGRVKELLKICSPDDILVLSFTNASAAEMRERLHNETGLPVPTSTFHALGLKILTELSDAKPRICRLDLTQFAMSHGHSEENAERIETEIHFHKSTGALFASRAAAIIYDAYKAHLHQRNEIDFHDMINLATGQVRLGNYTHQWKYVLIDEYQDISPARFALLAALRQINDFSVFAVGDDWQSIYAFTGSDINYVLNFEHFFGATTINKIETTYRFGNKLSRLSGNFIMQNQMQITKQLRAKHGGKRPALIEARGAEQLLSLLALTLETLPQYATVLILGRYRREIEIFEKSTLFDVAEEAIIYLGREDLSVRYLTAHRAKGLEADFVFILSAGFPAKSTCSATDIAEERRLLYVAMTRARERTHFLSVEERGSVFLQELRPKLFLLYNCPECQSVLTVRKSEHGTTLGCGNIKKCKYRRVIL